MLLFFLICQDEIHSDFAEPTKYLEELILTLPSLKSLEEEGLLEHSLQPADLLVVERVGGLPE